MTTHKTELQKIEATNVKAHEVNTEMLDMFGGDIHKLLADDSCSFVNLQQIKALGKKFRVEHRTDTDNTKGYIELPKHTLSYQKSDFVEYEHNVESPEQYTNDMSYLLDSINPANTNYEDWIVLETEAQQLNDILAKLDKLNDKDDIHRNKPQSFLEVYLEQVRNQMFNNVGLNSQILEYRRNGVSKDWGNVQTITSDSIKDIQKATGGNSYEYKFKAEFFSIGYEEMLTRPNGSSYSKITPIRVYVATDHIRLVGNAEVCGKFFERVQSLLRYIIAGYSTLYIEKLEAMIEANLEGGVK
jgi:hypothetical protein